MERNNKQYFVLAFNFLSGFHFSISLLMIVRFMRVDTLSLLLSMANVTAHANVLVVDKVGGLVTGAVAERLGGILSDISIDNKYCSCFFIRQCTIYFVDFSPQCVHPSFPP